MIDEFRDEYALAEGVITSYTCDKKKGDMMFVDQKIVLTGLPYAKTTSESMRLRITNDGKVVSLIYF